MSNTMAFISTLVPNAEGRSYLLGESPVRPIELARGAVTLIRQGLGDQRIKEAERELLRLQREESKGDDE